MSVDLLAELQQQTAAARSALGRHRRVPEARWGTITTYTPTSTIVTFPTGDTCKITHSTLALRNGAVVLVAFQGSDRWIMQTAGESPAGTVFYAVGSGSATDTQLTGGYGFGQIAFTPQAGRLYCLTWNPPLTYAQTATAAAQAEIRLTTDGSTPTIFGGSPSPKVAMKQYHIAMTGIFVNTPEIKYHFSVSSAPANPYKFLGAISRVGGTGTIWFRNDDVTAAPWYRIDDLGPTAATTGNTVTANTG